MAMTGNMRDDLTWQHGATMQPGGSVPSGWGNTNQTPVAEWAQGMNPQQQAMANMVSQPTQVPNLQSNVDMQPAAIGMLIANALGALSNDPTVLPRVQAQGMQNLNFMNRQAQQETQRKAQQAQLQMSAERLNLAKQEMAVKNVERRAAGAFAKGFMASYSEGGIDAAIDWFQSPGAQKILEAGGPRAVMMSMNAIKMKMTQDYQNRRLAIAGAKLGVAQKNAALKTELLKTQLDAAKLKYAMSQKAASPENAKIMADIYSLVNKNDLDGAMSSLRDHASRGTLTQKQIDTAANYIQKVKSFGIKREDKAMSRLMSEKRSLETNKARILGSSITTPNTAQQAEITRIDKRLDKINRRIRQREILQGGSGSSSWEVTPEKGIRFQRW